MSMSAQHLQGGGVQARCGGEVAVAGDLPRLAVEVGDGRAGLLRDQDRGDVGAHVVELPVQVHPAGGDLGELCPTNDTHPPDRGPTTSQSSANATASSPTLSGPTARAGGSTELAPMGQPKGLNGRWPPSSQDLNSAPVPDDLLEQAFVQDRYPRAALTSGASDPKFPAAGGPTQHQRVRRRPCEGSQGRLVPQEPDPDRLSTA